MQVKTVRNFLLFTMIFIAFLSLTGCAKPCTLPDCENHAVRGFDFCEDHLCQVENCGNEVVKNFQYCTEHLCSVGKCNQQVQEGEKYCLIHLCPIEGCGRKIKSEEKYCEYHLCDRDGCHNYAVGYCAECNKIVCQDSSCNERRLKEYQYCKEHKCKKKGCGKHSERKGFCRKHFKAELKAALSKLNKSYDSVENVTWYNPTSEPRYINSCSTTYLYLGRQGDNYWLRWRSIYLGNDWVFFDRIILDVDGEPHEKEIDYDDIERDSSYGNVWEWFDINPLNSDVELLQKISKSKHSVIRYKGDSRYEDRTITAAQKQGLKDILAVWELVG